MKATKYPKVKELPAGAMLVSAFAESQGYSQPQYVYVKYDRALSGKGSAVSFKIINFQGMNFVIKDN